MTVVDLNADVGEGLAADAALLGLVTSANIACGFHAGDEQSMREACEAAAVAGVAIGAHISYRDREGFGRRELDVDPVTIGAETTEQIEALQTAAASAGRRVAYVKPHGALYHRASGDRACAEAIVRAALRGQLAVLGFPGSELLALAGEAGLPAVAEGFADRAYATDGTLVPRGDPAALLGAKPSARQAVALARRAGSICIHSDTPGAADIAPVVKRGLLEAGFQLRPFTASSVSAS
jgi:UPF0271 protein